MNFFQNYFHLDKNYTTIKIELLAGMTTFMAMSYILVINPIIMSQTGMDNGAVLTSTAICAAIGSILMALFSNYPFAQAPAMGLNAYFAFTIVLQHGYSWQMALGAVFIEGVIFILLSIFNIREMIFNCIPNGLKYAISIGIGFFTAFIGLQNGGIIVRNNNTLISLGNIKSFPATLALLGTIVTIFFVVKKIRGAILFGILFTYLLGLVFQLTGIYHPDASIGMPNLIPNGIFSMPPSISPILFQLDLSQFFTFDFMIVVFSLLYVDLFNTLGTLIGVSAKTDFLDQHGKLPKMKGTLLADAVATTIGALLGSSTVTTYIESVSGIADGGKTGLTSLTTAFLFLISLLFTPIIMVIPSFATTPALILVGVFMMKSAVQIDFTDYSESFPAYLAILIMFVSYNIADGLIFGIISYTLLKVFTGRKKECSPVILVLSTIFILKLFF